MAAQTGERRHVIPSSSEVWEYPADDVSGLLPTSLSVAGVALGGVLAVRGAVGGPHSGLLLISLILILAGLFVLRGLVTVTPGEARVVQRLGRYAGTLRTPGLRWVVPLGPRRPVSTRLRNHETPVAKVNDADGNPIEIAAVLVWLVADTARALYAVDDFLTFVRVQAEAAVRQIAGSYPYDARGDGELSLRDNASIISEHLSAEIAARVKPAGVEVVESRLTRLAYAPEIAHAMLQRQQADAVVAARQRIVEGAVGRVEMALDELARHEVVELDEERKAAMVSNLLVVLCADRATQPVVNTGSLYQ